MSMQSAGSNAKVCAHVHVLLHVRWKRNRLKKNQKLECYIRLLGLQFGYAHEYIHIWCLQEMVCAQNFGAGDSEGDLVCVYMYTIWYCSLVCVYFPAMQKPKCQFCVDESLCKLGLSFFVCFHMATYTTQLLQYIYVCIYEQTPVIDILFVVITCFLSVCSFTYCWFFQVCCSEQCHQPSCCYYSCKYFTKRTLSSPKFFTTFKQAFQNSCAWSNCKRCMLVQRIVTNLFDLTCILCSHCLLYCRISQSHKRFKGRTNNWMMMLRSVAYTSYVNT